MTLQTAFDMLIHSYIQTARQREVGERRVVGRLPCVHYDYTWEGQRVIGDNFFVWNVEPDEAMAVIRGYAPSPDHQIFVVDDQPGLRARYESLGCRTEGVNYLMVLPLAGLAVPAPAYTVHRAATVSDAAMLNRIEEEPWLREEDLADPTLHFYYVAAGQKPIGRARNARYAPALAWLSHVYTAPEQRNQGIGTALVQQVLADSIRAGIEQSVLLSTEMAHTLYQRLGYRDLAPVITFYLPTELGS